MATRQPPVSLSHAYAGPLRPRGAPYRRREAMIPVSWETGVHSSFLLDVVSLPPPLCQPVEEPADDDLVLLRLSGPRQVVPLALLPPLLKFVLDGMFAVAPLLQPLSVLVVRHVKDLGHQFRR